MINILTLSEDGTRLSQIVRLVGECGRYRTTRVTGGVATLLERGDSLDAFDVLIVDAVTLTDADREVAAQLCHKHGQLTSILVTSDTSPSTLIAAMRAGFRDVLRWPLEQHTLAEALSRAESKRLPRDGRESRLISFMSCKGGAGTSFIAANIAHTLSTMPQQRVLLIDLNQLYGDAAFLMTDETPPSTLPQICAQVERMDAAFFDASVMHISETFHVLAGAGDPVKAAQIKEDRLEWILGVAMPRYDFVICDIGQTLNQISMLALDRSDQIHIVLQANMPHVRAGRRLQEILGSLGYAQDQTRLVLNRHTRHGERARAALEEVLGMRPFQIIPEDAAVVAKSMDLGVPVAKVARNSSVARSLQALAENMVNPVPASGRSRTSRDSLFARMLGRGPAATLEPL